MSNQWLELAKEAMKLPALLPEIYGDLLKPGVKQVGQALETAFGLCNTILSPITWANERTRIALKGNLEKYRAEIEHLPEEKVALVPPEIGVPILEKLGYVTNEELSDLYVNLLAKASCVDTVQFAHPSFVNIVNNLSPDEAVLLKEMHLRGTMPFIAVGYIPPSGGGRRIVADLFTGVEAQNNLKFPGNITAYFSNFDGLGLIDIRRDNFLTDTSLYVELETLYKSAFTPVNDDYEKSWLSFDRGFLDITPFGEMFMTACLTKLGQS